MNPGAIIEPTQDTLQRIYYEEFLDEENYDSSKYEKLPQFLELISKNPQWWYSLYCKRKFVKEIFDNEQYPKFLEVYLEHIFRDTEEAINDLFNLLKGSYRFLENFIENFEDYISQNGISKETNLEILIALFEVLEFFNNKDELNAWNFDAIKDLVKSFYHLSSISEGLVINDQNFPTSKGFLDWSIELLEEGQITVFRVNAESGNGKKRILRINLIRSIIENCEFDTWDRVITVLADLEFDPLLTKYFSRGKEQNKMKFIISLFIEKENFYPNDFFKQCNNQGLKYLFSRTLRGTVDLNHLFLDLMKNQHFLNGISTIGEIKELCRFFEELNIDEETIIMEKIKEGVVTKFHLRVSRDERFFNEVRELVKGCNFRYFQTQIFKLIFRNRGVLEKIFKLPRNCNLPLLSVFYQALAELEDNKIRLSLILDNGARIKSTFNQIDNLDVDTFSSIQELLRINYSVFTTYQLFLPNYLYLLKKGYELIPLIESDGRFIEQLNDYSNILNQQLMLFLRNYYDIDQCLFYSILRDIKSVTSCIRDKQIQVEIENELADISINLQEEEPSSNLLLLKDISEKITSIPELFTREIDNSLKFMKKIISLPNIRYFRYQFYVTFEEIISLWYEFLFEPNGINSLNLAGIFKYLTHKDSKFKNSKLDNALGICQINQRKSQNTHIQVMKRVAQELYEIKQLRNYYFHNLDDKSQNIGIITRDLVKKFHKIVTEIQFIYQIIQGLENNWEGSSELRKFTKKLIQKKIANRKGKGVFARINNLLDRIEIRDNKIVLD